MPTNGLCRLLESSDPALHDYYDSNAFAFVAATREVDMADLRGRFLETLPAPASGPPRILDAGTGSGRDARAFRLAGYRVEAFDAGPAMVEAASEYANLPVRCLRFEDFLWEHPFEGIWACASLLHVTRPELPRVLRSLAKHLVSDGVLYASFKLGVGERLKDGRHFTDMTEKTLTTLLDECPSLRQVDTWRSNDCRPDRQDETWLNALILKA